MDKVSNNSISFLGLANEYCKLMESDSNIGKEEFIDAALRLLPRLYITASDLSFTGIVDDIYIQPCLEEDYYESVRRRVETLLGEDDVFLEVFEEDMKFSDTPIAASIAECMSDIFQDLYDLINSVKDAPQSHINDFLYVCKDHFEAYWGQTLCNVLRALHAVKYNHKTF